MKKFEYKSINIRVKIRNFEEVDLELNKLGSEGWEVINFTTGDAWSNNANSVFVILKRVIE